MILCVSGKEKNIVITSPMFVSPGDFVQFIGVSEDSCDLNAICSGHLCILLRKIFTLNNVYLTEVCEVLCLPF